MASPASPASASRSYLVPCRCSASVRVGRGQAGGSVVCPECGAAVPVPRLRDLDAFVDAASVGAVVRRWPAAGGWLIGGLAAALAAAGAAVTIGRLGSAGLPPLPDADVIRATVRAADDGAIASAWRSIVRSGVDRGATPDEVAHQRQAWASGALVAALWVVAAAGSLVAAAAAVALALRRAPAARGPAWKGPP